MIIRLILSLCAVELAAGIRGVDPKLAYLYQKDRFHCLDGSASFPLSYVNDDYCDCADGSDEPGTAACPNGHFYCQNKHFKGMPISSSRVDDGICDCCDGSDEGAGTCANNCKELGAHLLEESRRIRKEQAMGFQQRLGYVTDGKAAKAKRGEDILVMGEEVKKRQEDMEERQKYKEEVEQPAIAAKEAAKAKFDAEEAARLSAASEQERLAAESEFSKIDGNNDGDVTTEELLEYGASEDSLIAYEDIKLMVDNGEVEPATLLQSIQDKIHQQYEEAARQQEADKADKRKRAKKPKLPDTSPPVPVLDDQGEEMWGEDGKKILQQKQVEDEEEEEEADYPDEFEDEEENPAPIINTFTYDPATQKLIDVFEEADELYRSAKTQYDTVKLQLDNLHKLNEQDFGPDEEFSSLHHQCFDYNDEKYRYKLCMFEKSEQNGLSLGKWEGWSPDQDGVNRYTRMKYSNGQSCWNGPARSTVVLIECGASNELYSATEPAKCEYQYKFRTPAACTKVQQEEEIHDEL